MLKRIWNRQSVPEKQIYLLSAFILLLTAWFSLGFNHFDEHCQIVEFAGYKLGLTAKASLPWEFDCRMRPALQPFVVYIIYRGFSLAGISDPFFITFITRLIAAAISFTSALMLYKLFRESFPELKLKYSFLLLSFLLWFLVYNSVRFSSETLSGRVFIIGFAWFFLKKDPGRREYFMTGLLLGISFLLRYQVALMIFGFGAWLLFMKRVRIRMLLILILGIFLMILLGIILDRWLYGDWVLSAWNYFRQNMILKKAESFGTYPWWYYFEQTFMNAIPPFSLVYILAVILYIVYFPKDCISWIVVPFLLFHFIEPHKEIRFLFPIIGFLPLMMISSGRIILKKKNFITMENRLVRILVRIFWYTSLAMMVILVFRPADEQIPLYKKIYYNYTSPVKLYFTEENPYRRASVNLDFYKRQNMSYHKIDSIGEIRLLKDTVSLLVMNNSGIPSGRTFKPVMIFASYPLWVRHFNINHWIERTSFWYVYELKPLNQ